MAKGKKFSGGAASGIGRLEKAGLSVKGGRAKTKSPAGVPGGTLGKATYIEGPQAGRMTKAAGKPSKVIDRDMDNE